ncbi:hypothetical protein KAW65_07250 [candidate division WOR-3 bacterium]|nr:hypothetical protein [candidate division WOR-3 bacterium]
MMLRKGEIFIKRGTTGILLTHGFCKTPDELRLIACELAKRDITVYCPLLQGHGSCPNGHGTCLFELVKTNLSGWKDGLETSFLEFRKSVDKICVGGSSLGANLALWLATKYEVEGVISISCAIILSRVLRVGMNSVSLATKFLKNKGEVPVFHTTSIFNLMDMKSIIGETRKSLAQIKAPILIMHPEKDKMILPKSAAYIYNKVSSKKKELIWIKTSEDILSDEANHYITTPELSKKIAQEIYDFVKSIDTDNHK